MDKKTKELLIVGLPMVVLGGTVGTLTKYDFVKTTIAFMVGGFIGNLILKLINKK